MFDELGHIMCWRRQCDVWSERYKSCWGNVLPIAVVVLFYTYLDTQEAVTKINVRMFGLKGHTGLRMELNRGVQGRQWLELAQVMEAEVQACIHMSICI